MQGDLHNNQTSNSVKALFYSLQSNHNFLVSNIACFKDVLQNAIYDEGERWTFKEQAEENKVPGSCFAKNIVVPTSTKQH